MDILVPPVALTREQSRTVWPLPLCPSAKHQMDGVWRKIEKTLINIKQEYIYFLVLISLIVLRTSPTLTQLCDLSGWSGRPWTFVGFLLLQTTSLFLDLKKKKAEKGSQDILCAFNLQT